MFINTIEERHDSDTENSDDEEILEGELLPRIQRKLAKGYPLCFQKFEQKVKAFVFNSYMALFFLSDYTYF